MKYRSGPLNLQRASLKTLREHAEAAKERLRAHQASLEKAMAALAAAPSNLRSAPQELQAVQEQLAKLYPIRQPSSGLLGRLFGLDEQPPSVVSTIGQLQAQEREIRRRSDESNQLTRSVNSVEELIQRALQWQSKLQEGIARHERKRDAQASLRAAAAANSAATRTLGAAMRRRLERQPWCPYCGGSLGVAPHADHIYPVSKGGRSVIKNMVFCCSPCNGNKRDLTLVGFIRKFGLDRSAIEARLEELGKEY